jgi:iron complex transport system ATP-binding protein
MSETPALHANKLSLMLGGRTVVNQVSVSLAAGQWVAIIGPNGAGKSSLLSMLAGLRKPASGEMRLHGRPMADWPGAQRARELAWLAQQGESEGDMAARDVVLLGRLPHHGLLGAPGPVDEAAVDAAMAQTECTAFAHRRLNELSGGERQRVLLARALAVQAPVMLLDEPTTHLDAPHQRALMRCVAQRRSAGCAVAVVLHDLTLALAADRVWLMDQGRVVANAAPGDPALHAAMAGVFEHAVAIESLHREGRVHHVVRPLP